LFLFWAVIFQKSSHKEKHWNTKNNRENVVFMQTSRVFTTLAELLKT